MSNKHFKRNLEHAVNCAGMESGSDTPDFIIAEYLSDCLKALDRAVRNREKWYGRKVGNGVSILNPGSQLSEGMIKKGGKSSAPITPKPNIRPPAQRPK